MKEKNKKELTEELMAAEESIELSDEMLDEVAGGSIQVVRGTDKFGMDRRYNVIDDDTGEVVKSFPTMDLAYHYEKHMKELKEIREKK